MGASPAVHVPARFSYSGGTRIVANNGKPHCISPNGRKILFTSTGNESGDGVWIADQDRRSPPSQLTHGGESIAFLGKPGEIIYMSHGNVGHLYRMKEDGTGNELVVEDPIDSLEAVSPDGKWAVVQTTKAPYPGLVVKLRSRKWKGVMAMKFNRRHFLSGAAGGAAAALVGSATGWAGAELFSVFNESGSRVVPEVGIAGTVSPSAARFGFV